MQYSFVMEMIWLNHILYYQVHSVAFYLVATVWGDLTKAFSVSVTLLVGLILVPL